MSTQFILMYHPALGNRQATVPLQAVDDYAATGWLLVDPDAEPPAPATPYYTTAAADSRFVQDTQLAGRMAAVQADEASTFSVEQRAAFGALGHDVALPSGARVSPLPGILRNEWRYNSDSFIQDNVTTVGNVQYAVWVNEAANPVVGKHLVGSDAWQTFDLSTIPGNPIDAPVNGDGHNVYVVAVDSAGYIHVAGDMHAHPLHYVRSVNPGDITSWVAPGMVGADEDRISYPQFIHRPTGSGDELMILYRQTPGLGTDGDFWVLNAYNATTKTWTRRSTIIDGVAGNAKMSPYVNRTGVAADGTLHVFYLWRDTNGNNLPSIGHLKSSDGGVTWSQMGGAATTVPVTYATHVQVGDIAALNSQGADVDSLGRPHAAFMSNKGFGLAIRHLYWSGTAWVTEDVLNQSVEPATISRTPRVALFCRGAETFVIYSTGQEGSANRGGGAQSIRIRNCAPADRHVDALLIEANLGQFEVTLDSLALRNRDELNILITTVQGETGSQANLDPPRYMRSAGGILTYPLSLLRLSALLADGPVMNERVWIPASSFDIFEGAPTRAVRSGAGGWVLPDGATSSIVGMSKVPDRWQGYNVDVWWVNQAAATGAIRVRSMLMNIAPGSSADAVPNNYGDATLSLTAGANGVITASRTLTEQPKVTYDTDRLARITVRRLGADGSDTLAADALILGVMLSPALIP